MSARKAVPKAMPLTWSDATVSCSGTGWRFTIPVPERVNAVWRQFKVRTIISARHRRDKRAAPALFGHVVPLSGDVVVEITWFRERRIGDVDGRLKSALDLLRGIAYADDAQVASAQIQRVDDPHEAARLEIHVWPRAAA